MKKFLNLDAVFGSILLSNFVSGEVATLEKTIAPSDRAIASENIEDRFVGHFKANPLFYNGGWTKKMLDLAEEGVLETKLQGFCAQAHRAAGFGDTKVNVIGVNPSSLKFDNEKYPSRKILVLTYGAEDSWHNHNHRVHHYRYVTKGTREDCVFYLDLANPAEYKLEKEVCGIEPVF